MPDLSPRSLANIQALLVELDRLGVVALMLVDNAKLVKGASYARFVTQILAYIQALLVELDRLGVVALMMVDHAKLVKGDSYARFVTQILLDIQALLVELDRLGVVALIIVDHAKLVKDCCNISSVALLIENLFRFFMKPQCSLPDLPHPDKEWPDFPWLWLL